MLVVAEWRGGVVVRTLDFVTQQSRIPAVPLSGNDRRQVVHIYYMQLKTVIRTKII